MKAQKIFLAITLAALGLGCKAHPQPTSIKLEMLDAYQTSAELYRYVWAPSRFKKPEAHDKLLALLDRLASDFHRIEKVSPALLAEPGFKIALQTNQEMLKDIRDRFASGNKDYANWRLRGLTSNCLACHSRHEVKTDFLGELPTSPDESFEDKLAAGEFLFATRQFDKASNSLLALAHSISGTSSGSALAMRALKLWLVIEVRVKDRFSSSAKSLDDLMKTGELSVTDLDTLRRWSEELKKLAKEPSSKNAVQDASRLLDEVKDNSSIESDEQNLVQTLRATTLLHGYLEGDRTSAERQTPTYLLALAYSHLPISVFDGFRELYLEQCIREFPGTAEAQAALKIYKQNLEIENSGSGGLHLDDESKAKLDELTKLATPTKKPATKKKLKGNKQSKG